MIVIGGTFLAAFSLHGMWQSVWLFFLHNNDCIFGAGWAFCDGH